MNAPPWTATPAAKQAIQAGDYANILRLSRLAAGLTLGQLAAISPYSTSTLSRLESGRRPVRDIAELRRLARLYDVPDQLLGLASTPENAGGSTLATTDGGGEIVRRRSFIAGSATLGVSAILPQPAGAAARGGTIEEVLFGRISADPLPAGQLAAQIAAARADYRAARYTRLARRLPHLLAQAVASRAAADTGDQAAAASRLAQAYGVATQLLIKMHDNGMAFATADRAVQAASSGTNPLVLADSHRLAATVLRRLDHGDTAQRLVLDAAEQLRTTTSLPDPAHHAMYGKLLAVAAYTAANRDDRDTAWMLLGEAGTPARAAGTDDRFTSTEVAVYRISIARKLGDYGAAVDYARKVDPRRIDAPERRARYWQDTALALHGRGRPTGAFDALQAADHDVPEEVRHRPWAQQLTRDLLSSSASHSMPRLRDFAARIGAV